MRGHWLFRKLKNFTIFNTAHFADDKLSKSEVEASLFAQCAPLRYVLHTV